MVTTAGTFYIVAVIVLFFFWIYGLISFYFDLRYRFLPFLARKLRERRQYDRPL